MAVIQISRIQVRRGVADSPTPSGLPQLASGEIGWAIDQQRLWIGSGSIDEGAPAVSNVEILTTQGLLDILDNFTATNYTYRMNQGTGGGTLGSVQRTIQEKLDDKADALDFGIVGDGVTDDTTSIQNAINALYFNNQGVNDGPVLSFHPGNFIISETINVPPHAKLVGSGIGKSTFTMISSATTAFQTVGLNSSGTAYLSTVSIISPNFPTDIQISGFTFQVTSTWTTTQTSPLLSLDSAKDTTISDCSFVGIYSAGKAWTVNDTAIRFTNVAPYGHNNVLIDNCIFEGISCGIVSNSDIDTVRITNSRFKNNAHGAYLGYALSGNSPSQTGPKNVQFIDNMFNNTTYEAIYVGTTATNSTLTNILSMNNTYRSVGVDNVGNSVTPILTMKSAGGESINDNFERVYDIQAVSNSDGSYSYHVNPTTFTMLPLVDVGGCAFKWDYRLPFKQNILINDNTQNGILPLATIPYSGTSLALLVNYVYTLVSGDVRMGKLFINSKSTTVSVKEEFSFTGDTSDGTFGEIVFSAAITNGVLQILGSRASGSNVSGTLSLTISTVQ